MEFFTNCATVEELKKEYHRLARMFHPDLGTDLDREYRTEQMKRINGAYDAAVQQMAKGGAKVNVEQELDRETREKIDLAVSLEGVQVEIIGVWVWITGNTYEVKDLLKGAGFKWGSKKKAWFWYPAEAASSNRRTMSLDEIRQMHGSQIIKGTTSTRKGALAG